MNNDEILSLLLEKITRLEQNAVPRREHEVRDALITNRFDKLDLKLDQAIQALSTRISDMETRVAVLERSEGPQHLVDRIRTVEANIQSTEAVAGYRRWLGPILLTMILVVFNTVYLHLHHI